MQLFVATNLTSLHREPSFHSEMLTQVFNAMSCEVLEERENWVRVRMEDGYEGWAHRPYLSESSVSAPTHIVARWQSEFYPEHAGHSSPISRLLAGTKIAVTSIRSTRAQIQTAGLPMGWIDLAGIRRLDDLPIAPRAARDEVIQLARSLTGVYYLWGGNTALGTDCSGLVWQTHRLCGYSTPRDAHPQFHAALPVEQPYQRGDLFFFRKAEDPNRISHVGICTGGWNMIHSSRNRNGVYEEDVQANPDLRERFAGARAFMPR
jgi:cell wall-associated NlpC family hydrolase